MAEPVSALRGIDKALSVGSWLTAAVLVVMLFAGPAVIANDEQSADVTKAGSSPYAKKTGADGAQVFKGNCGTCHTLSAAGTSGAVGPNLDDTTLSASEIEATVRSGRGSMPSFDGRLSDAQIAAVAAFVDASR
jgi:mono/diheme cytochrome c family protein